MENKLDLITVGKKILANIPIITNPSSGITGCKLTECHIVKISKNFKCIALEEIDPTQTGCNASQNYKWYVIDSITILDFVE